MINFAKKYPVRDITKIKKFIDKLNVKLKNNDFELVYEIASTVKITLKRFYSTMIDMALILKL